MNAKPTNTGSSTYRVIGLMSGTSLDGLDIAYCTLQYAFGKWSFRIIKAHTLKYTKQWHEKLSTAHSLPALKLMELHNEYGAYLGACVKKFAAGHNIKRIDLVASHGYTVFHQPAKHITFQLGHGAAIAAVCGLTVVNDFRALDVMLGGQGAPLIPLCDKLLFPEYDFCLNLGGFANISYRTKLGGKRLAFDICPANIALNHFARKLNREYDAGGVIAASASADKSLLARLNALNYYKRPLPKSLGREWLESEFLPAVNKSRITVQEKIATITEHIALQTAKVLNATEGTRCLVTGGGAFNTFLIQKIREKTKPELAIPGNDLVNFKEALGFALLGVLRMRGENNCLKSVTGASKDSSGGAIY